MPRTTQRRAKTGDRALPDSREQVVARFVATGTPIPQLAQDFGLSEETVRDWIRQAAEDVAPPQAAGPSTTERPDGGDDLGGLYEMISVWSPEDEVIDNAARGRDAIGDEPYEIGSWTGFDDDATPDFRAEVVALFLASGATVPEIAGRFGLDEGTVRGWIREAAASAAPPAERSTTRRAGKRPAKPVSKRAPKQVAKQVPKPVEKVSEPPAVELSVDEAPAVELSVEEAPAVELSVEEAPAVEPEACRPAPDDPNDLEAKAAAWAALVAQVYPAGTPVLSPPPDEGAENAPPGEPAEEAAAIPSHEELQSSHRRRKRRWARRKGPIRAESELVAPAPEPATAPLDTDEAWRPPATPLLPAALLPVPVPVAVVETRITPEATSAARASVEQLTRALERLPRQPPALASGASSGPFLLPLPNRAAAWQPTLVKVLGVVRTSALEARLAPLREVEAGRGGGALEAARPANSEPTDAARAWVEQLTATLEPMPAERPAPVPPGGAFLRLAPHPAAADGPECPGALAWAALLDRAFDTRALLPGEPPEVVHEAPSVESVEDAPAVPEERWVEVSGWTLAQARQAAFDRLGVDDGDACIEVVQPDGLRRLRSRVHVRARLRTPGSPQAAGEETAIASVTPPPAPLQVRRPGEWIEASGRNEAEAREAALDQLGVDDGDAEVELLARDGARLRRRVHVRARVRCLDGTATNDAAATATDQGDQR